MYHWRRGNTIGASRTIIKAINRLEKITKEHPSFSDGINIENLVKNGIIASQQIKNEEPFSTFQVEVTSTRIGSLIKELRPSMDLLPYGSDEVIHKHMLRDRSDILNVRENRNGRGKM